MDFLSPFCHTEAAHNYSAFDFTCLAVLELVDEELKSYRARVSCADRLGQVSGEKAARVPDWTPTELAGAALEAKP
jgi:hypothetical protein